MSLRGGGTFDMFFGDGSDGDVVVTGSVSLARDYYYNNLTFSASSATEAFLSTNSFKVNVKNRITFVTSGTIDNSGLPSTNGTASSYSAGTVGSPNPGGTGSVLYPGNIPSVNPTYGGGGGATGINANVSWLRINLKANLTGTGASRAIAVNSNDLMIVVGENSTGSISRDNGLTWTATTMSFPDPVGKPTVLRGVVYAGNGRIVVVGIAGAQATASISPNNGTTWGTITTSFNTAMGSNIPRGIAYGTGSFGEAVICVGNNSSVARSTDGGTTWSAIAAGINGFSATSNITSVAFTSGVFVAVGNQSSSRSTDGGITWSGTFIGQNLQCVGADYSGTVIAGKSSAGEIYRSTDAGLSWTMLPASTTKFGSAAASSVTAVAFVSGTWFIGGADNSSSYSTDGGLTWNSFNSYVNGNIRAFGGNSTSVIVVGTAGSGSRNFTDSGFTTPAPNVNRSGSLRNFSTLFSGFTFMSSSVFQIFGGSGGKGGVGDGISLTGSAGGSGGGVLFVAAREIVAVSGTGRFKASGGASANCVSGTFPGGGGGGGVIMMFVGSTTGSIVYNVSGGLGGTSPDGSGSAGATGSVFFFQV